MEHKAKHFVRLVLGIHLILLVALLTGIYFAVREVYDQTRRQVLDQVANAQELLAAQTADGIESFYNSISNNLDLIHRANTEEPNGSTAAPATQPAPSAMHAPQLPAIFGAVPTFPVPTRAFTELNNVASGRDRRFGPLLDAILWQQLEGRASLIFPIEIDQLEVAAGDVTDRVSGAGSMGMKARRVAGGGSGDAAIRPIGPLASSEQATDLIKKMRGWLRHVDKPSVSTFQEVAGLGDGNVVCVPSPIDTEHPLKGVTGRRLYVAFVPISTIRDQFLDKLNPKDASTSATLADERMVTMVSSEASLVGVDARKSEDLHVRELAESALKADHPFTVNIEHPYRFGGVERQPRVMTVTPVGVMGKRWYLMISSRLSTAEGVVNGLFRRALYWAIFVVAAMTGILVSTSVWLIRGRMRLERIRHEMLTKELTQAREIQKAWLPQKSPDVPNVDVSAVNHPASHISGDFYNWFELPDGKLVVAIGDVTGHGMSAAFLMATTQLLVRNTMPRLGDPGACLEEVNRQLCMQAFNGQFVTMLIAVVDVENAELHVATAGHYPPLMGDGSAGPFLPLQMEPELVLGVEPESEYRTETFDLPPNASLLMYTDGVLDLEAPGGKRYGKDGLRKSLTAACFITSQAMIDHVLADLDRFRDRKEIPDDLTLVAVQLTGQPATRPAAVAVG